MFGTIKKKGVQFIKDKKGVNQVVTMAILLLFAAVIAWGITSDFQGHITDAGEVVGNEIKEITEDLDSFGGPGDGD